LTTEIIDHEAYEKTSLDFRKINGLTIQTRYQPFYDYVKQRQQEKNYPFARQFYRTSDTSLLKNLNFPEVESMNYGSQDYLGLSNNTEVLNYAIDKVREIGFHSAGSPVLVGRTQESDVLEKKLTQILNTEYSLIFPTGWMACFAAVAATVTSKDHIILDEYAHNCLQVASKFSTNNISRVKHNNINDIESHIVEIRKNDTQSGIFIIVESLYSMHSDTPNIQEIYRLSVEYDAIIILDIAHDFGNIHESGLGILNRYPIIDLNRIILCGSFSKAFASVGGFISGSKYLETQITIHSSTYMFSNAIPQFQTAIINKCFDIIFSNDGKERRKQLIKKSIYIRQKLVDNGFKILGIPSAIIPIEINSLKKARFMSKIFEENGIILNLVEFPAVPRQIGLFRLQISSAYEYAFLDRAINLIIKANTYADSYLK